MSGLFSSLNIAISGLNAHQTAINVISNNIANVDTEGYSRQRLELMSERPIKLENGLFGQGVKIGSITRIRNVLLDSVYRSQNSSLNSSLEQQRVQARIEDLLFEPSDQGITSLLDNFFGRFQELTVNPEEQPLRSTAVTSAIQLADAIRSLQSNLDQLRTDADREIRSLTTDVNTLLEQVADINSQISDLELSSGQSANDLRDRRDLLLDKLSDLIAINTNEADDGTISISSEGIQLVTASRAYHLEPVVNPDLDPVRKDFVDLVVSETGSVLNPTEGRLAGLKAARDSLVPTLQSKLDGFARVLIQQVNAVHTQGHGLRLFDTVTGSTAVATGTETLALSDSATGLAFPPSSGSFDINVVDGSNNIVTTTIDLDPDTESLADIESKINSIGNLHANLVNGALQITSDSGYTFGFSNDSSGFLAATGINTLFTGSSARNIDVNPLLDSDPSFLAVALSPDPRDTGDNTNAVAISALQSQSVPITVGSTTESISMSDFLRTTISDVGILAQRLGREVESEQLVRNRLDTRRQEISGVSINEETADLIKYQRGFEASAKLISIIDEMLQTLIQSF